MSVQTFIPVHPEITKAGTVRPLDAKNSVSYTSCHVSLRLVARQQKEGELIQYEIVEIR